MKQEGKSIKYLESYILSTVGRTAWELFQQDVEDPFLQELLQLSYKNEPTSFLGIDQRIFGTI